MALFLVKLKLNLPYIVLGKLFSVNVSARKIFENLLNIMAICLKDLIIWIDKDTIKARLPYCFKALYPEIRCIFDVSEIECARPKCAKVRVLLYSNYKSRFTVKLMMMYLMMMKDC